MAVQKLYGEVVDLLKKEFVKFKDLGKHIKVNVSPP